MGHFLAFCVSTLSLSAGASSTGAGALQCDHPGPEPLIVSFEGGVGCGKSTQIDLAQRMGDVLGVVNISSWPEPLSNQTVADLAALWRLAHIIDEYRANGTAVPGTLQAAVNAFALRAMADVSRAYKARRVKAMTWACEAKKWGRPVVLLERTIGASRHVFARFNHQRGYLTDAGLKRVLQSLPADEEVPADAWMFFLLSPETAIERIEKRHRAGEGAIDTDMIRRLDGLMRKYSNYLIATHGSHEVYSVDASGSIEEVLEITTQTLWKILHGAAPDAAKRAAISSAAHRIAPQPRVVQLADVPQFSSRALSLVSGKTWVFSCLGAAAVLAVFGLTAWKVAGRQKDTLPDYFMMDGAVA